MSNDKRDRPHPFSWRERGKSFVYAWRGIRLLWREHNTHIHLAATAIVAVAGMVLRLTATEWCAIVIVMGLVWITEALNTAIERLCDHVTAEKHPAIAAVKDVAAAAVLLSAITAAVVGIIIFIPHIMVLAINISL